MMTVMPGFVAGAPQAEPTNILVITLRVIVE
jgi:hypothetical protein